MEHSFQIIIFPNNIIFLELSFICVVLILSVANKSKHITEYNSP